MNHLDPRDPPYTFRQNPSEPFGTGSTVTDDFIAGRFVPVEREAEPDEDQSEWVN